jgi:hypothetical protein
MILGTDIPLDADVFVGSCLADARVDRRATPADKYLDYLANETQKLYPMLFRFVKVLDRETGTPRFNADADHIVPKSVWNLLMPDELIGLPGEKFPGYSGVISNLFWRDIQFNRKDDNLAIRLVKESSSTRMSKKELAGWKKKWISIFIATKHDEGVLCTADKTDPHKLDELVGPSRGTNWMAYGIKGT